MAPTELRKETPGAWRSSDNLLVLSPKSLRLSGPFPAFPRPPYSVVTSAKCLSSPILGSHQNPSNQFSSQSHHGFLRLFSGLLCTGWPRSSLTLFRGRGHAQWVRASPARTPLGRVGWKDSVATDGTDAEPSERRLQPRVSRSLFPVTRGAWERRRDPGDTVPSRHLYLGFVGGWNRGRSESWTRGMSPNSEGPGLPRSPEDEPHPGIP